MGFSKEHKHQLYLKNKERLSQKHKDRLKNDPEFREKCIASSKNYYLVHPEKFKIYNKKGYWENRENILEQRKIQNKKNRSLVLIYYSHGVPQCACCGELELAFLTIDHIDGRKKWNHSRSFAGHTLSNWLVTHNYPDGFQILCYNCNSAKGRLGTCPHKLIKKKVKPLLQ